MLSVAVLDQNWAVEKRLGFSKTPFSLASWNSEDALFPSAIFFKPRGLPIVALALNWMVVILSLSVEDKLGLSWTQLSGPRLFPSCDSKDVSFLCAGVKAKARGTPVRAPGELQIEGKSRHAVGLRAPQAKNITKQVHMWVLQKKLSDREAPRPPLWQSPHEQVTRGLPLPSLLSSSSLFSLSLLFFFSKNDILNHSVCSTVSWCVPLWLLRYPQVHTWDARELVRSEYGETCHAQGAQWSTLCWWRVGK